MNQGQPTKEAVIQADDPSGWKFWKKRRYIVALFTFFGYVSAYSLRVNLSIAIVAMTTDTTERPAEFDWDRKLQGIVLSAFFYGYCSTQILGGWLSARIGGKRVFAAGIGVTAIATIVSPPIVRLNVYFFIAVRILEGIFEGLTIPCTHAIWSRWAPPLERSRLAAISYTGNFVGALLAMPSCALLAEHLGWPSVFYIFGVLGVVWASLFWYYVADNPFEDPRISESELTYIQKSLGKNEQKTISHPWKAIFLSVPCWAVIVAHFSEMWGFYTMLTQLPRFMKDVLNFNLDQTGYFSALPYLIIAIIMPISGHLIDYVRTREIMTTTTARKVTTCTAFLIQTVFITTTAFVESSIGAVICLSLGIGLGGFAFGGFGVNHLDLAPRHASVLIGISNTFATTSGFLSPIATGYIVQNGTPAEWRTVFMITGGIYLVGALTYALLGSGERQSWAQDPEPTKKTDDSHAYSNPALDVDSHI